MSTPAKRLTLALPADVWDRLDAEAKALGVSIGTHARVLIIARDERKQKNTPPQG